MPDPDSGDLLLLAAGDGAALDRLVARWKKPVYAVFERTRDAAAAAEATADVFDGLRARAHDYDPATRADAFLHRILAERIRNDSASAPTEIAGATLAASGAARQAFVRGAIGALPPAERAAFLLSRVASLPPEVAAEALRLPVPEVQRQVVHALALLRATLEPAIRHAPALGPVERHFGAEMPALPADLDHRLAVRLASPSARRRAPRPALAVAGVVLLAALAALVLARRRSPSAGSAGAAAPAAPAAEAPAPGILRVDNAPVTVDTVPASEAEERLAAGLFPPAFLLAVDGLAALDPFFPEDAAAERAGPPSPRPTVPASSPVPPPEEIAERISFLRHLPTNERDRIASVDALYRERPEAERVVLAARWEAVRGLREETAGGLRPLAQRVSSLPAEKRAALAAELRSLRAFPVDERLRRFRTLPFAQALTGQERAAAEALLAT